jgi:hypothetical protein
MEQAQYALDRADRLERVEAQEPREGGKVFVDLGIILHGAGPKGIESQVHAVVLPRKIDVVPDDVYLRELRQVRIRYPEKFGVKGIARRFHGNIDIRVYITPSSAS